MKNKPSVPLASSSLPLVYFNSSWSLEARKWRGSVFIRDWVKFQCEECKTFPETR